MIKFDKNEFLKPQIYSTLDEYETRCNVTEEIIKEIEQLKQANEILKENAENNDKVVDKVNWENMLLKKENKQLKEEYNKIQKAYESTFSDYQQLKDKCNKLKEYFNERIEICDNRLSTPFCNFEKVTKERLIFSQCLEKLEELEKGSDSNE